MKKLFSSPLFITGLLLRLALLLAVQPQAETQWYLPFLDITTQAFTLDPWGSFLASGGDTAAFPYGYAMWLAFLPMTWLCNATGAPAHFAYSLTLLVADICLLLILRRIVNKRDSLLLGCYWLSPIVLLATYWLGLNDLIPVTLLCLALHYTRQLRLLPAGLLCGAALSAKLSMVLAIPFFLIYLFRNQALRQLLPDYLKGLALSIALLCLPFMLSSAGLQMLLSNPEMDKVYRLAIHISSNTVLYIVPMIYLLTLYVTWLVRRLNFDLFCTLLGVAFLLVVLLTPSSPGWFIWILPLLVLYQANNGKLAIALTSAFSLAYALTNLVVMPLPDWRHPAAAGWPLASLLAQLKPHLVSLLYTGMITIGIVLALRMWRGAVQSNDYFRLSRKPFVVGIAGDSGSGKDTLASALVGLFGQHSVATLSGDDYHLWDRQKPMWQVMTHLNPMANDLECFANDLVSLVDGRRIHSRHYDHQTGKMSRPRYVKSNDIIIASGLHALYLPILRNCYDLSIYLDIDEGLRRHLKLQRDVHQRGHDEARVQSSLQKREPDSIRFVRPQSEHADLIMSLQPIHPRMIEDSARHPLRYKLHVRARNGLNELSLMRTLVGICGLHVDMNMGDDSTAVELTIEGDASAEDIALSAQMLLPRIMEFLDIKPQWQGGMLGLMQLITLSHINQALNKRLLWQNS